MAYDASVKPSRRPEPSSPVDIYILQDELRSKIGMARDVRLRVKALSAGNPGGLAIYATRTAPASHARRIEAAMHRRFSGYAIGREWFKDLPVKEALVALDDLIAAAPAVDPIALARRDEERAAEMQRRIDKYMPFTPLVREGRLTELER